MENTEHKNKKMRKQKNMERTKKNVENHSAIKIKFELIRTNKFFLKEWKNPHFVLVEEKKSV